MFTLSMIYILDQKFGLEIFGIKNGLFTVTNIVKNSDKEKWVHSGYGIAFDGKWEWIFGNEYARNFVIFGVDNSSSSHSNLWRTRDKA